MIKAIDLNGFQFKIEMLNENIVFVAESAALKNEWVETINNIIEESKDELDNNSCILDRQ